MERNLRKERVGLVTSDKMDKTVVVTVELKAMHPLYKKTVTTTVLSILSEVTSPTLSFLKFLSIFSPPLKRSP